MSEAKRPFRSLPRDERRSSIVRAAKRVILENGLAAASMDDVAARAGTTKPTVYAHFASKDELFAAVAEMVRGLLSDELKSPADYADEPVEAVARFCARFLELVSWGDAVAFQRVALAAAAAGSPAAAVAVHEALHAGARRTLAAYLRAVKLTRAPERQAELLLSATTGGPLVRHLFGIDEPHPDLPDAANVGARVDLRRIRATVKLIASEWKR